MDMQGSKVQEGPWGRMVNRHSTTGGQGQAVSSLASLALDHLGRKMPLN